MASKLVLLLLLSVMLHFGAIDLTSDECSQCRYPKSTLSIAVNVQRRNGSELSAVQVQENVTDEPTVTAVSIGPNDAAETTCKPIEFTTLIPLETYPPNSRCRKPLQDSFNRHNTVNT